MDRDGRADAGRCERTCGPALPRRDPPGGQGGSRGDAGGTRGRAQRGTRLRRAGAVRARRAARADRGARTSAPRLELATSASGVAFDVEIIAERLQLSGAGQATVFEERRRVDARASPRGDLDRADSRLLTTGADVELPDGKILVQLTGRESRRSVRRRGSTRPRGADRDGRRGLRALGRAPARGRVARLAGGALTRRTRRVRAGREARVAGTGGIALAHRARRRT